MIEKLIKSKQDKLAEYEAMKKVLDVEKRSAFNNDERDKANALKIELENINEQIKIEESMTDVKRSLNDKKVEVNVPINVKEDHTAIVKETDNALRSFMLGKSVDSKYLDNGKFQLSADYQTIKRATITTSTNGAFVQTTTLDQVSVTSPELVLQKAGAQKLVFEANKGDVKAPSMTGLRGVFVSEGSSTSELALTSASATLRPTLLIVPLKLSKAFIATQSAANFAGLIQDMFAGIDRGLEYKAFQQLSGLTATSVASGTSFYATVCDMEANVIGAGSAYIFSRTGTARAKQKYIGGSNAFETVWKNDSVNGYPSYRSSILSDVRPNDGYYGNFKDIALATFGPISLEIVTDATLALAGEVLLTVSVMADSKVINSNSFARVNNVHQLS